MILRIVNNLSLRMKISLILLLALIPTTIVSMLGFSYLSDSYSAILYRTAADQLSDSGRFISSVMEEMETLSYMILSNDNVQENLYTLKYSESPPERSNANEALRILLGNYYNNFRNSYLSYIDICSGEFKVSGNSYASGKTPSDIHAAVQKAGLDADGAPVWISSYSNEYGLFLGREIRQIKNLSLDGLGEEILCVNIDELVESATQFGGQYERAAYLLLDREELIYYSDTLSEDSAIWIRDHLEDSYQILCYEGHSCFAVRGGIRSRGWDYICLIPYDEIMTVIRQSRLRMFLVLALCILIVIFMTSRLISSLVRPFGALVRKMEAVGRNEKVLPQNGCDYHTRKDEIGTLHQQFDLTFTKLQTMIQTNYVNEILRQEAQLKALENQINPHFLYNTLESVNWRAKAIGADDISDMVQSLGTLLRSTLSRNDKGYTLQNELELVQCYLTIQKYRFQERLHYHTEIPEEYGAIRIPKLSIQPLVENAIQYENDRIYITVKNSGSQFEEDLLGKMERGELAPRGHGIGLLNIRERIRLTFGGDYDLRLSNEGDWAAAVMELPFP